MNPKVKRHEELVKKYAGKKMPDDIDVYEGFTSRAQTANLEQQIKSKKFSTYLTKVGQGWRVYPIEA